MIIKICLKSEHFVAVSQHVYSLNMIPLLWSILRGSGLDELGMMIDDGDNAGRL